MSHTRTSSKYAGPSFWDTGILTFLRIDRILSLDPDSDKTLAHYFSNLNIPLNEAFMVLGGIGLAFNIVTRCAVSAYLTFFFGELPEPGTTAILSVSSSQLRLIHESTGFQCSQLLQRLCFRQITPKVAIPSAAQPISIHHLYINLPPLASRALACPTRSIPNAQFLPALLSDYSLIFAGAILVHMGTSICTSSWAYHSGACDSTKAHALVWC